MSVSPITPILFILISTFASKFPFWSQCIEILKTLNFHIKLSTSFIKRVIGLSQNINYSCKFLYICWIFKMFSLNKNDPFIFKYRIFNSAFYSRFHFLWQKVLHTLWTFWNFIGIFYFWKAVSWSESWMQFISVHQIK